MTRSRHEYQAVLRLLAEKHNDCAIARLTGIPRSTIKDWRNGKRGTPGEGRVRKDPYDLTRLPVRPYAYLLGLYLGDGCISAHRRGVYRLRIFLDMKYPQIIAECKASIEAIMPEQKALVQARKGCVEIGMYSKQWPRLFPQHGPGRKHERPIRLEKWQLRIVRQEPRNFLRGLIHSDGCRVVANDRGVRSVRYHFSNLSEDIKRLYCDALDSLGIAWTRPSHRDIAVYRKAAVAKLDEFIGPKQ